MTQNINLLPTTLGQKKSPLTSTHILQIYLGWVMCLVLIYLGMLFINTNKQHDLKVINTSLQEVQHKIASMAPPPVLEKQPGFYNYLHELAQYIPQDTWLEKIVITKPDNKIFLEGKTLVSAGVIVLLRVLNKTPSFSSIIFDTNLLQTNTDNMTFTLRSVNF